jgi:hypothetical protein
MDKEALPPKIVKAQLVRLDDNLKQIERTQFAGIQRAPGSLPVLEAFQQFLENERRIARRRLLVVTAVCLIAIVLTVAASGLYIHYTLRQAHDRTDALARTAGEMEQTLASLSSRQTRSDQLLQQTGQALQAQQQSITRQAQRLAEQQEALVQGSEVIRLREQVETLLADQETIKRMLTVRSGAAMAPRQPPESPAQTIGPARRRIEPDPVLEKPQYAVLTLASEGRSGGIRWMLPTAGAPE